MTLPAARQQEGLVCLARGQFCPVAKAAEIVAQRRTPLVLRELLTGYRRFNDLRRGLPLMSPSLMSGSLKSLEKFGIVAHQREADGQVEYHLTPAGEELRRLIMQQGGCYHFHGRPS